MRTLLTIPDMAEAVGGLLGKQVTSHDLHDLINSGDVRPFGRLVKAPAFTLHQIPQVAAAVAGVDPMVFQHQYRPVRDAAIALRLDAGFLADEVEAGRVPGIVVGNHTYVNTIVVRDNLRTRGL